MSNSNLFFSSGVFKDHPTIPPKTSYFAKHYPDPNFISQCSWSILKASLEIFWPVSTLSTKSSIATNFTDEGKQIERIEFNQVF